jgi:hypothetical protein
MAKQLPRIARIAPIAPATVHVAWKDDRPADTVDLRGWIATGGDILAALTDPAVFAAARVAQYGSAIAWGDDDSDLMINAVHLRALAIEQCPFDAASWQAAIGLSNREAADLLGVSLSTWNGYKAGATVPTPVAIACRAAQRDPMILQAHSRPRKTGRPRKATAG